MNSVMSQLPKVSYIKLIDIWMTGCVIFVFAAFGECVLVNRLFTREKANDGSEVIIILVKH